MRYSEIPHFSHPKHKLHFDYLELPFKCDGCNEVGIGSRYKCDDCDFDLHVHCALPIASLCHPFYPKCNFHFLSRPPGDKPRFCNACEKDVSGFVYHCESCGFDLHPCCARLPFSLDVDDGHRNRKDSSNVELYLYRKVAAPCHRCGRKGRSWSYRSACKKYNLHVACVREMLVESWHEVYAGRGSNNTVKIPSLKGTLQSYHHNHRHHKSSSKGKVQKCCEIAGTALQIVISAVLGDPTALIAGVIGSIISRS